MVLTPLCAHASTFRKDLQLAAAGLHNTYMYLTKGQPPIPVTGKALLASMQGAHG